MLVRLPSFTPTPDIPFGGDVTSSGVNTPDNNIENYIDTVDIFSAGTLTGSTTITNANVLNFCNANSASFTVTLPLASSVTTAALRFKKIDTSINTITLQCAGTDVIENPFGALTTPTSTSYLMRFPDEEVTIYPISSGVYRIISRYVNHRFRVRAFKTVNQNVLNGQTLIFESDSGTIGYDLNNNFASNTYTCPVSGFYLVGSNAQFAPGSSAEMFLALRRNGTVYGLLGASQITTSSAKVGGFVEVFCSAGDTLQVEVNSIGNTRTVEAGTSLTFCTYSYLGYSFV